MISPLAYVDPEAKLGKNVTVLPFAYIEKNVEIGDDCVILSGNVTLHQYCHIGSWTLVQSGCRVSKDVPPYVIMSGNPVAYHGVNAVVLSQHHNTSERILRHIANAYRLIYQGNFSIQDAVQKIVDQVPMSEEIENIVNFVKASERGIVK